MKLSRFLFSSLSSTALRHALEGSGWDESGNRMAYARGMRTLAGGMDMRLLVRGSPFARVCSLVVKQ